MTQFMKKTSLGRMIIAEGGASDRELAEVRLTPDEYFAFLERVQSAEKVVAEAQSYVKRKEEAVYKDAREKLALCKARIQAEADRRVECANAAKRSAEDRVLFVEQENEAIKKVLEQQRSLNCNLKRIARERANAKRGLTPKKERSGYIVLFSVQYKERYRNENNEKCLANTWKSVMQTPYDATIPLEEIVDDIWIELTNHILYSIGFRMVQSMEKNGEYISWTDGNEELCGLYRWDYKANYKSGFWEMSLYHTKSLKLPEEFRPVRK